MINWPEAYAYLLSCPPHRSREQLLRLASGKVKVKAARPKIRLPRGVKQTPLKALKRKAWAAFSKWIRQRDAGEGGFVKCCTCNEVRHWKGMDAGHFESRVRESTLFDEQNVHAQCKGCNMPPNNGRRIEYAAFLDEKYGPGTASAISARARRREMTRDELEAVLAKYSAPQAPGERLRDPAPSPVTPPSPQPKDQP